ncbi:carboxypeptidase regulatory-like domain-containing protein [bacterium]|nr:carboxypeptidase regulatory-like domain-containing protein [bacterium]
MKKTAILTLCLFFTVQILSAGKGTITGSVSDSESGEPLQGANVFLDGIKMGASTMPDGSFIIPKVPEGSYVLRVLMLGYTAIAVNDVVVTEGDTVKLNIRLNISTIVGECVTITADKLREKGDVSASEVKKSESLDDLTIAEERHEDSAKRKRPADDVSGGVSGAEYFDFDAGSSAGEHRPGEPEPASPPVSAPPVSARKITTPSESGLKAGYADDNQQFNYFLRFLEEYKYARHFPLRVTERIVFGVRDENGKTCPNATVQVSDGQKPLCEGTTYADGSFMFFPSEYDEKTENYHVRIKFQEAVSDMEIGRQGQRHIETVLPAKKTLPERVPMDILFILDTTGSMGEEINRLKATLEIIHLNLNAMPSHPLLRFGLVLYRDRSDDYVTQVVPLTEDLDLFRSRLDAVQAGGGGDGPEDLQSALRESMQSVEWNSKGIRLAFIITDAPPHLDYDQSYTYVHAASEAKERGIKLFSVGTGGLPIDGEYVLRQISQYTSAKYLFLTYGERSESDGGQTGSVSHHTGENFTTDKLESIIIHIAREEMGAFTDTPVVKGEDYFAASRSEDEKKEATLKKLFSMALAQLRDYSSVHLAESTPTVFLSFRTEEKEGLRTAEYFSSQFLLSLGRDPVFRLVERKDLQQILDELKLGQSGLIGQNEAVQAGEMTGADLIIMGDLYKKAKSFDIFMKLIRVKSAEILSVTKMHIDKDLGL